MSAKHTSGPWTAFIEGESQEGGDSHVICAGEHLADVANIPFASLATSGGVDGETLISEAEAIANARLIAAAPELLYALEQFMADEDAPWWIDRERFDIARRAIAKATGDKA